MQLDLFEILNSVSCIIKDKHHFFCRQISFYTECSMKIEQIPVTQIKYHLKDSYHSLYIIGVNHLLYFDSWPNFLTRLKHVIKNLL